MDFHYLTYFLNGFLMIAMPVGLGVYLTRRFKLTWRLFWIGSAAFVFSQVLHIPFNALVTPIFNRPAFIALPFLSQLVTSSIFLGLSAGLFEELSRYAMFRWIAKDARTWSRGLLAGAGHGGLEAILLGALVLYAYLQMISLRGADLAAIIPAAQLGAAQAQIAAYWSAPWYMTILGAVERLFTIPLHLACSILVLQSFTRKRFGWVGLAVLLHAFADGAAVYAQGINLPALVIEGIIGIFAIVSVLIVFALRQPELQVESITAPPVVTPEFKPLKIDDTDDKLEKTRYQ